MMVVPILTAFGDKPDSVLYWADNYNGVFVIVVPILCIGMILEVLLSLSVSTYGTETGISVVGIAIGLLCFWLLQKRKMSVPKVIGIAAALGVVGFGVL